MLPRIPVPAVEMHPVDITLQAGDVLKGFLAWMCENVLTDFLCGHSGDIEIRPPTESVLAIELPDPGVGRPESTQRQLSTTVPIIHRHSPMIAFSNRVERPE